MGLDALQAYLPGEHDSCCTAAGPPASEDTMTRRQPHPDPLPPARPRWNWLVAVTLLAALSGAWIAVDTYGAAFFDSLR
jgi:hypothetical protein